MVSRISKFFKLNFWASLMYTRVPAFFTLVKKKIFIIAMDFTQRLPSEVFLAIFKSLSLVLKWCNSFAIDNHVWYHLALIR